MTGPIDLDHFEAVTFGDRALQDEILTLFEVQAAKLLATISDSDGKARSEAAHALKGAARGIGAFAVADEAEKIERGTGGSADRLASHIAEAQNAAAVLRARA
ncbi:MAG TPA: Hpt domain-containing protein [Xanthobacteraceae bacterium]|nr:Hpt domain-containing protein [Xanthobacteraceae bacterium]